MNVQSVCQRNGDKPFPIQQILDSSKLRDFAEDNFEFDRNGKYLNR